VRRADSDGRTGVPPGLAELGGVLDRRHRGINHSGERQHMRSHDGLHRHVPLRQRSSRRQLGGDQPNQQHLSGIPAQRRHPHAIQTALQEGQDIRLNQR